MRSNKLSFSYDRELDNKSMDAGHGTRQQLYVSDENTGYQKWLDFIICGQRVINNDKNLYISLYNGYSDTSCVSISDPS